MTAKKNAIAAAGLHALVVGDAELSKLITSFKSAYGKAAILGQLAAVSVLVHAAQHGNPDRLNEFVRSLRDNDRIAFGYYTRRIFAVIGGWDGVTVESAEAMNEYKKAGAFLSFGKGTFSVLTNDTHADMASNKAKMQELAPALLNPDGEVWKPFLEANNLAEIKTFDDGDLLKALKTAQTKAAGESDSVKTEVSQAFLADLSKLTKKYSKLNPTQVGHA